jgi:hypothetical protein
MVLLRMPLITSADITVPYQDSILNFAVAGAFGGRDSAVSIAVSIKDAQRHGLRVLRGLVNAADWIAR